MFFAKWILVYIQKMYVALMVIICSFGDWCAIFFDSQNMLMAGSKGYDSTIGILCKCMIGEITDLYGILPAWSTSLAIIVITNWSNRSVTIWNDRMLATSIYRNGHFLIHSWLWSLRWCWKMCRYRWRWEFFCFSDRIGWYGRGFRIINRYLFFWEEINWKQKRVPL